MLKVLNPALKISHAKAGYDKTTIINDVSLTVDPAEIVALLGRNGAGKTTLMRYITSIIPAMAGEVKIGGVLAPKSAAKRAKLGLGYVPQGRYVFPRLTVVENIAVAAATNGHNHKQAVEQAMQDFPLLVPKAKSLAGSLSGGQQQILSLARALATQPKILLLDEPTEGVQPSLIDEMAEILLRINRQKSIAILIAEQNLDFCLSLASRAYIMNGGKIQTEMSVEALKADKPLQRQQLGV